MNISENSKEVVAQADPITYDVELPCHHPERGLMYTNWRVKARSPLEAYERAVALAKDKGYGAFSATIHCQIMPADRGPDDRLMIKSELAYGVAGKAWVALDDGKIVDLVPMRGESVLYELPEDFDQSQIPDGGEGFRFCCQHFGLRSGEKMRSGRTFFRQEDFDSFEAFREVVRAHLARQGEVVSGVASQGAFIVGA